MSTRATLKKLLDDLGHHAGADGAAAFADGKAQTFFHGDGGDQLHRDGDVVTRHHHFGAGVVAKILK